MPSRTFCTSLQYVAGALQRPNGICLNWYNPQGVEKAVFSLSSGRMETTWKAPVPSMPEKTLECANRLRLSAMEGIGKLSLWVTWLRRRKSQTHLVLPFFLATASKGKLQGDCEGSITSCLSQWFTCSLKSGSNVGLIGRFLHLMGGMSSVWMACWTKSVLPYSSFSLKMSAYFKRRFTALLRSFSSFRNGLSFNLNFSINQSRFLISSFLSVWSSLFCTLATTFSESSSVCVIRYMVPYRTSSFTVIGLSKVFITAARTFPSSLV